MKKLLLIFLAMPLLVFAQKTPKGVTYDAQIIRVNDGDTVVISAPFLPAPLKPELAVRIFGVDTPEKNTTEGKAAADAAKNWFTSRQNTAERFSIEVLQKADKYGRRLVYVKTDKSPTTLNVEVIKTLGSCEYFGGTKKKKITATAIITEAPM